MEKVWKIKGHQVMKGKGNDRNFLCVEGNANSLLEEKYSIEKLTKFPKYSLERTYHVVNERISKSQIRILSDSKRSDTVRFG